MSFVWHLNDEGEVLRNGFAAAVAHLRSPAGPKYKSFEDIRMNQKEFGRDFYNGLFNFHVEMIRQILLVEKTLKSLPPSQAPEQRTTKRGLEHLRQIFRTFNDCIAWTIFLPEPSFTINRLCRHRPKAYLSDQNPDSILEFIAEISSSGETLAIWNDATRCIDLHDVTAISLEARTISFYEVKEGLVNEEILQIAAADEKEVQKGLDGLFARRGASGIQQFVRFAKQQVEGAKLFALATNDEIEDPFLKKRRIATTPHKLLESYDSELSELLQEVRQREFARITVDGCLHVLAINQVRLRHDISIDSLIERELINRLTIPGPDEPDCRTVMIPFQDTFYSPISMPVMIRPFIKPIDVADLCIGNVALFFMFDMNAWGKLFQECRLTWSSTKDGRRERSKPFLERQMVINNRIPIITSPAGKSVRLGDRILPVMICEGIRPLSMVEHYDYHLTHSKSEGEQEKD